jgi:glycosyltransferase involved in cell wall biosynthesis
MKVMTVMYTLKRGGAYDRFKMMVETFLEREWEVHCLSLTPIRFDHPLYYNHVLPPPIGADSDVAMRFFTLSVLPFYSLWVSWRRRVDLFVAFGSLYAFVEALAKCVLRKPMITLIRGDSTYGLKVRGAPRYLLVLNGLVEDLGLFFSDRIIAVNQAIRDKIIRGRGKRKGTEIETLFNNITPIPAPAPEEIDQTRAKFGISKGAKVLVTAGILNGGKNIEMLIRSLSRIGMDAVLLIIGDGATKADLRYKTYLIDVVKTLSLRNGVIFTGWLDKETLWRVFRSADLFLLPSRSEGMPNVMLEALGCDLPCLGSRIPGIEDILQYEELMFDPMDEQTIVNKVRKLFSDIQYFRKIKGLCQERKKAFIFDWKERMFQTVTGVIRS